MINFNRLTIISWKMDFDGRGVGLCMSGGISSKLGIIRMRIMIKIIVNEDGDDDQIGDNVVMAMSFNPKTGQWTLQRSQRSNLKILMNFLLFTISFYTCFSFACV